jgi:hypothetical protein
MYYLSRSRSALPACLLARLPAAGLPREPRVCAWQPSLPPLVATAREISRLRENGRMMLYDDHRERYCYRDINGYFT